MTCNRDKNSMEEEAANCGIPLRVGLGGEVLETQSESRCRQAPRLPRKVTVRQAPRLPRKVKVDVTKCQACHANSHSDRGRPKRATRASPVP